MRWLQRLYYWWVIGDWRLAKQEVELQQQVHKSTDRQGDSSIES